MVFLKAVQLNIRIAAVRQMRPRLWIMRLDPEAFRLGACIDITLQSLNVGVVVWLGCSELRPQVTIALVASVFQ